MVFVLVCLCPAYCVPNVASVSVFVLRIVYPMSPVSLSLSYVLYTQCRQCLCLCPTYCVPNVASVSVFVLRIVSPMSPVSLSLSYVLCPQCRQCLWIVQSWFSNVYSTMIHIDNNIHTYSYGNWIHQCPGLSWNSAYCQKLSQFPPLFGIYPIVDCWLF